MKAQLIISDKSIDEDFGILQIVIWKVPDPVPPTTHGKYRLAYIREGKRVVGFDNERGKGDHKHVGDLEHAYRVTTIEQLLEDFSGEVEKWRE
ncbi:toxin-antitoxin system TumE family protein [Achromobacter sp. AGC39]